MGTYASSKAPVILCIDDDLVAVYVRKLVLEQAGFHVSTASTAEEGLEIFKSTSVDLVLSDHFLQGKAGTEIAAAMKALNPDVPIVILSGAAEIPPGIEYADLFLSKLEPPPVLLSTINQLLQRTA